MRKLLVFAGACCLLVATAVAEGADAGLPPGAGQVRELQERITGDPDMLALVMALQADPAVQALLNDPKVIEAVQAGDYGALVSDPRLQALLENARVKELGKRLENQGFKVTE